MHLLPLPPSTSPPPCSAFDPTGTWSLYIPLIPAAANNQPSVIYWRSSSGPLSPSPGVGARNVRGAKENKAALRDELSASGTLILWIEPIEKIIPVSFYNLYPEILPPPTHTRGAVFTWSVLFSFLIPFNLLNVSPSVWDFAEVPRCEHYSRTFFIHFLFFFFFPFFLFFVRSVEEKLRVESLKRTEPTEVGVILKQFCLRLCWTCALNLC